MNIFRELLRRGNKEKESTGEILLLDSAGVHNAGQNNFLPMLIMLSKQAPESLMFVVMDDGNETVLADE